MRRHRCWLSACFIVLLLLPACSVGQPPPAPGAGTPAVPVSAAPSPATGLVTIGFGAQEWERSIYEPLIEQFNAENADMQVQFVPVDDVYRSARDPNNPFDPARELVSRADTAASYSIESRDMERNLYYNLTPLMEADPSFQRDDYYPTAFGALTHNGNLYGLPRTVNLELLHYNKELWAAKGLPPPGPSPTWQELIAAAEQLATRQGDKVETYGLLALSDFTLLRGELHATGQNLFDQPTDQWQLDTPQMQTVLERAVSLVQSGAVYSPDEQRASQAQPAETDDLRMLVNEGRVAVWSPSFLGPTPNETPPPFPVGTLAMPDVGLSIPAWQRSFVMSSGTQHPEQAWRWLSFLSRQSTTDEMRHSSNQELPARKSLAEQSSTWQSMDEETKAAAAALLQRPVQPLPANRLNSHFSAFGLLVEAFGTMRRDKKPADEALREAQNKLQEQIAQAALTPQPTPAAAAVTVNTPVPNVAAVGATSIKFIVLGGDQTLVRRLAGGFNQNNPSIFVEVTEPPTIVNSSGSRAIYGSPSDLAAQSDCFMTSVGETRSFTATLDLQPLVQADPTFTLDDYPAGLLQRFQQEGRLNGLPYSMRLRQLFYNTGLFQNAGLEPPNANWTTDEFLNAAQQLTKGSGEEKQYGFVSESRPTQDLDFFLARFGAERFSGTQETLQPTFTDPNVVQAARFYIDLLKNTSPHTELQGYTRGGLFSTSPQLISSGRAGMWFEYGTISLGGGGPQRPGAAVAPPPMGQSAITSGDYVVNGLFISGQTQHAEACWTWMKYMSEDANSLGNAYPARISVAESPAFQGQAPPGALDVYNAYREALSRTDTSAAERSFDRRMETFWFYRAVDRALQGKDLEQELADAQKLTEDFILCAQPEDADLAACAKQVDPTYEGFQQPRPSPAPASP